MLNNFSRPRRVVITGIGCVTPIGIGREAVTQSYWEGRSGVRTLPQFDVPGFPVRFAGEVVDFDAKQFITPRKSLKVMSREIQMAVSAATLAVQEAGLDTTTLDPERFGVVFGADMMYSDPEEMGPAFAACVVDGQFDFSLWAERAFAEMNPLWLLKYLPNMPACHIAIGMDARGPNNTITQGEASTLLALAEAQRLIERGAVDIAITGGVGRPMNPTSWIWIEHHNTSRRAEAPIQASRPFDAGRDGVVYGEGAAAFVVESRAHAEARQAKILARVLGYATTCDPRFNGQANSGNAIRRSITLALADAKLAPQDIGHVNAHGLSTVASDRREAAAIRDTLGNVPVTAPKSLFGNLGAGGGAVEMIASMLALETGRVPATLNYEQPDPHCPIEVIHGSPATIEKRTALLLNQSSLGQSAAVILAAE